MTPPERSDIIQKNAESSELSAFLCLVTVDKRIWFQMISPKNETIAGKCRHDYPFDKPEVVT